MSDDFANMSLEDLVVLRENAEKLISKKQKERSKDIKTAMDELAMKAGFDSVEEFIGSKTRKKKERSDKGKRLPPKYRHPNDESLTWSGRGPAPKWIQEHEANGGNRNEWQV